MKMVLNEVFARLAGDGTAPAIHRLETAFGGGKTHTLACITGKEIDADDAPGIGQQALASIASVVSRDATSVIPAQASEISQVLAKRLFTKIEESVAKETADLYREMYRKIKDKGLKPVDITSDFI